MEDFGLCGCLPCPRHRVPCQVQCKVEEETADVLSLGWLASVLAPEQPASIPPAAIEGLQGGAVKYFTGAQLMKLSAEQMAFLSPHAASFISVKMLEDELEDAETFPTIRVIRAAVGEDPRVMKDVMKVMEEMEDKEETPEDTTTSEPEPEPESGRSGTLYKPNFTI